MAKSQNRSPKVAASLKATRKSIHKIPRVLSYFEDAVVEAVSQLSEKNSRVEVLQSELESNVNNNLKAFESINTFEPNVGSQTAKLMTNASTSELKKIWNPALTESFLLLAVLSPEKERVQKIINHKNSGFPPAMVKRCNEFLGQDLPLEEKLTQLRSDIFPQGIFDDIPEEEQVKTNRLSRWASEAWRRVSGSSTDTEGNTTVATTADSKELIVEENSAIAFKQIFFDETAPNDLISIFASTLNIDSNVHAEQLAQINAVVSEGSRTTSLYRTWRFIGQQNWDFNDKQFQYLMSLSGSNRRGTQAKVESGAVKHSSPYEQAKVIWETPFNKVETRNYLFEAARRHNILPELYFFANAKGNYFPKDLSNHLETWCSQKNINLHKLLLDYKTPDSAVNSNTVQSKAESKKSFSTYDVSDEFLFEIIDLYVQASNAKTGAEMAAVWRAHDQLHSKFGQSTILDNKGKNTLIQLDELWRQGRSAAESDASHMMSIVFLDSFKLSEEYQKQRHAPDGTSLEDSKGGVENVRRMGRAATKKFYEEISNEQLHRLFGRMHQHGILEIFERHLANKKAHELPSFLSKKLDWWKKNKMPILERAAVLPKHQTILMELTVQAATAGLMGDRMAEMADNAGLLSDASRNGTAFPVSHHEFYLPMQPKGFYLDNVLKLDEVAEEYATIPDGYKNEALRQQLLIAARKGVVGSKPETYEKTQLYAFESARALGQMDELHDLLSSEDSIFPPEETKKRLEAWKDGDIPKGLLELRQAMAQMFPEDFLKDNSSDQQSDEERLSLIFKKLGWDSKRIFKRQSTYDGHLMKHLVQAVIADEEAITESERQFVIDVFLEDHERALNGTRESTSNNNIETIYKRACNFMAAAQQYRFFEVAAEVGSLGRLRSNITHENSALPIKMTEGFNHWYSDRLDDQEIPGDSQNDEIVRKQLWFDKPSLVLTARKLDGEEFSNAFGIEDYDDEQTGIIRRNIDLEDKNHTNNMGRAVFGSLQAITSAEAEHEYKRSHLFAEILNLSKPSDEIMKKLEKRMQGLAKREPEKVGDLASHPAMLNMGEGAGWDIILNDQPMREDAFNIIREYNLTAPFYFLLRSKNTYAPDEAAKYFTDWCKGEGINLRQALVDYELIDLTKPKPDVVIDLETPLATQLIQYGISTTSEERNDKLRALSAEDLQAASMGERDHAWLAHHVRNIPAFEAKENVSDAITTLLRSSASSEEAKIQFGKTLAQKPELFTPPVPALWLEYNFDDGVAPKTGFLLEQLPDGKPGLQIMQFILHKEHGVLPNIDSPIFYSITEPSGDELETTIYKNNEPFQPATQGDLSFVRSTATMLYFVATLNDTSQQLRFMPALKTTENTDDQPLGTVELAGSKITLNMEKTSSVPGINAPVVLTSNEVDAEDEEQLSIPSEIIALIKNPDVNPRLIHAFHIHSDSITQTNGRVKALEAIEEEFGINAMLFYPKSESSDLRTKSDAVKRLKRLLSREALDANHDSAKLYNALIYTPSLGGISSEGVSEDQTRSTYRKVFSEPQNTTLVQDAFQRLENYGLLGIFEHFLECEDNHKSALPTKIVTQKLEKWKEIQARNKAKEEQSVDEIVAQKQAWFDSLSINGLDTLQNSYSPAADYHPVKVKVIEQTVKVFSKAPELAVINGLKFVADLADVSDSKRLGLFRAHSINTLSEFLERSSYDNQNLLQKLDPRAFEKSKKLWNRLLRTREHRESLNTLFYEQDSLPILYFILNAKDSESPERSVEFLENWCDANDIDLKRLIAEFELPGFELDELENDTTVPKLDTEHDQETTPQPAMDDNLLVFPKPVEETTAERIFRKSQLRAIRPDRMPNSAGYTWWPNPKGRDLDHAEVRKNINNARLSDEEGMYMAFNEPARRFFSFVDDGTELIPANDTGSEEDSSNEPLSHDHSDQEIEHKPKAKLPAVFSGITSTPDLEVSSLFPSDLSEDEQIEILLKYDEAYNRTAELLLAEADMFLMQALHKGYDQFTCFIDLNKPGFAIHLRFSGEIDVEDEKQTRAIDFTLDNYAEAYNDLGIPLTMENAVDLKIAVQSIILNTDGVHPARYNSSSGSRSVTYDTQMPTPSRGTKPTIRKDTRGMCSLTYTVNDPYNKGALVNVSVPLGMALHFDDEVAEQRELDERKDFVLSYLNKIEQYRTPEGFRAHIFKRDVMAKLKSWLEENNKEWETSERMDLPGFEESRLIHVFSQSADPNQSRKNITLASISLSMDVGGENASWNCYLNFYMGDENSRLMGNVVHTRFLSLRTRDPQLALARTLETLNGVKSKSGSTICEGLIPTLQRHVRENGDGWRVEKQGRSYKVLIGGGLELQDALDDMMRYERDIGVKLEKQQDTANGNQIITLQALRSLIGDLGETVQPTPEYVYERDDNTRKPIAFSVKVPKHKAHLIDSFVKEVHDDIVWYAEDLYSSVALGQDDQLDKRKSPREYRVAQIRNGLIRSIEAIYEGHFGYKLPKNWHREDAQTALRSSAVHRQLPTPQAGLK